MSNSVNTSILFSWPIIYTQVKKKCRTEIHISKNCIWKMSTNSIADRDRGE